MAERGLSAIQPRTFVPRTSDGRADKPAGYLVKVAPKVEKKDQIWVGDITFIPTSSGWFYLAIVVDAFQQAARTRDPDNQTIFHSDRGSQYGSIAFRAVLKRYNLLQSMSGKAILMKMLGANPSWELLKRNFCKGAYLNSTRTLASLCLNTSKDTTTPKGTIPLSAINHLSSSKEIIN
jgi:transposase InsO family protein